MKRPELAYHGVDIQRILQEAINNVDNDISNELRDKMRLVMSSLTHI